MSNKNIVVPSNGNNLQEVQLKMAAQIDNLYQRVAVMDGLISDLLPGVQKMTKELNNSINELRYRFERDETLQLLKKVGDNIPTMIQLVEVMEAVKGLLTDVAPAAPKMVHELNDSINALRNRFERDETFELMKKIGDNIPTFLQLIELLEAGKGLAADLSPVAPKMVHELNDSINELRNRFEKDETFELLKKVGDNIPTFLQLIELLEAGKGLVTDLAPVAPKMVHELNDSINQLRNRFERDETFELMKKVGDNIPTFLQLIELLEAGKGLAVDLAPAASKMVHELTPAINTLRYALEKDEVLTLIKKAGDNLPVFIKLLDFVERFNATGDLDSNLNSLLAKETKYFLSGLEYSAVVTMKEFMDHPFEPGMKNVVSSLRDPDVQKGMVFMTTLLKNLHNHMLQTVSEAIMSDLIDKDKK
ncbi:MAG: DUF1641 domain-containing protein [Nitrospirae bacterium]|nr:DUF1641 domain-containing protein [Nitrospirota bacterium]